MKVAYITRTVFGAIGTGASYMFPSMAAKHHDVIVISPSDPNSGETVIYHDDNVNVLNNYNPKPAKQLLKTYRYLKRFSPDIIHLFNHPNCHEYIFKMHHLMRDAKWVLDIRTPLLAKGKKRKRVRKLNFLLPYYVNAIITHSMGSIKTQTPICPRKAIEIPPGVNQSLFKQKTYMEEIVKCRKFVYIGNLSPLRSLEFLLDNFITSAIKTTVPVSLDIYGTGLAEDSLRCLVEKQGGNDIISFKGAVSQHYLSQKLHEYDAGIAYVPNGSFETAPSLKSLEFMAAGLPIIASDTVGHRNYSKQGFDFNFFKNLPGSFLSTILRSVEEGINTVTIQDNLKLIGKFNWERIVKDKLLPLYDSLCQ